jgi:hypothetical protein
VLRAYLEVRFIFPAVSFLPPFFYPQASAVLLAALEAVQAWPLPEAASAPVVGARAAEPLEADCAAADARPAEAFAGAVPEQAQPVLAVVDYSDAQLRVDRSVPPPKVDSQDDWSRADSAADGSAEPRLACSVPDVPQAD